MRRSGLVWSSRPPGLVWGWGHGALLHWPQWVKELLVNAVNPVCCALWGHDRILEDIPECRAEDGTFHCTMCCKPLR